MDTANGALDRWAVALVKGVAVATAALVLPFLVYGALAFNRMGLFVPSGYMPLEALSAALEEGSIGGIWRAPVASLNATSGELVSAMYEVTVGALLLAAGLGIAVMLDAARPRACARSAAGGWLAGGGLLAAIGAAPTVLLGCCGGGAAGAILALAGLTSATAAEVSVLGQPLQAAIIVSLLARAWRPLAAPPDMGVPGREGAPVSS